MKVLTPAALTPHGGSLRLLYLVFRTSNPQPRDGPERRFRSRLNVLDGSCDPGFAMNEQARRTMPPKRVRHPAGCSFASSCSPPRIAATQLPSATCATTSHRTDFHPPDKATSQTHIGVGKGLSPPLPPNRAGGFPAHGSPVAGFHIGDVSLGIEPWIV
jgi:hypothetical protein